MPSAHPMCHVPAPLPVRRTRRQASCPRPCELRGRKAAAVLLRALLLKSDPDYLAVATKVNDIKLYTEAAALTGTSIPKSQMRSSKLMDGVVWDGKNPAAYAAGFKIKA